MRENFQIMKDVDLKSLLDDIQERHKWFLFLKKYFTLEFYGYLRGIPEVEKSSNSFVFLFFEKNKEFFFR